MKTSVSGEEEEKDKAGRKTTNKGEDMEEPSTHLLWLPGGKSTSINIGSFLSEQTAHSLGTVEQWFILVSYYMSSQVSRELYSTGQCLYESQDDRWVTTGRLVSNVDKENEHWRILSNHRSCHSWKVTQPTSTYAPLYR